MNLNNKTYDTSKLPAVPQILVELLHLCHQDDPGFEKFSSLISRDTSLTARILQIANSPVFRQWKDVTDLRRILIVMGMHNLKTIVTACAVEQFFSQLSTTVNQQVRQIWIRSVFCANLCERLARLLSYHKPGEAFLAGLLYQSGMLILLANDDNYQQLLQSFNERSQDFCLQERDIYGVDHCELGATMVQSWNIDSFLADAVRFQQSQTHELHSAPTLLKIVAVAAAFSNSKNQPNNPQVLTKAAELLGLTAETTLECHHEAMATSTSIFTALGISDPEQLFMESGHQQENDPYVPLLREAVRRVTLSQLAAPETHEDLITFSRQMRISFSSTFPVKQLLLLRHDNRSSRLIPVNDLDLHQLDDLIWEAGDNSSRVVAAFRSGTQTTLTNSGATIADQQLLRLLDSSQLRLLPLLYRGQNLGVIVLEFFDGPTPYAAEEKSLLSLFSTEIARRLATLLEQRNSAVGMSVEEFRKFIHEISNPLSIINNYLYVLGKKLDEEDTAREELRTISAEIDRIGRFLLHAGDQTLQARTSRRTVDINALIVELDRVLRNSLYSSAQIASVLHLDDSIPVLEGSPDKLKQILINLLKNAAEALAAGKSIQISTRDNIIQDQRSYIEIIIKDNGPGIPQKVLQNLFNPVTSSKKGHSGLGLVVVNTLIKEMGGNISCFSNSTTGTEFKILLPRNVAQESTLQDNN